MSTPKNPMELVDRYLQAVRFWMPKMERREDTLAELGEDLRSQIEAKEVEVGHALDADEVSEILKRCGSPMVVGSRLGPSQSLIGPGWFPIYKFVLKMVLLWIQLPIFLFILGPINLAYANGDLGGAIAKTISELWSAGFVAAGVITLVFAILERTQAQAAVACKWDPQTLPPLHKREKRISTVQTVSQLIFGLLGLVWLLLLPQHPFLILGPAASFLKAAPAVNVIYVPLVILSLLSLVRSAITLVRPQWQWFPPVAELVSAILSLLLMNFLINAAGQTPNGDWHPYVMLTEAARGSAQYIKVAAIVNLSILICVVCSWIGLGIGVVVQLWRLFARLRKPGVDRQPAPLQVL